MYRLVRVSIALALAAVPAVALAGQKAPVAAEAALRQLIAQYQEALDAGSVDGCAKLFRPDAAWLQPDLPITNGLPAIRDRFDFLSKNVVVRLKFDPMQITAADGWGYADVHITGTTMPTGSGTITQDNKALFVFRQERDGSWRIARYMVNSNHPGAAASPR